MDHLNSISLDIIKRIIESHKHKEGPIKLMLQEIQKELGYIPFEAMKEISNTIRAKVEY